MAPNQSICPYTISQEFNYLNEFGAQKMKDLNDFLAKFLESHKERMKNLRQLTKGVAGALLLSRDKDHWYWPYTCAVADDKLMPEYKGSKKKTSQRARPETSISTQAMMW